MNWLKNNVLLLLLVVIIGVFHYQFFLRNYFPLPSDTIVGMYHPFRDKIWDGYISGVPFKNPLITDPVRQQYAWRELSQTLIKKGEMPVWNPYSFSGTPLLANFQTSAFYPLNFFYFIIPTPRAWSLQVILSQLMVGIFLFIFLKNQNFHPLSAFLGSLSFSFSGFVISWLTWNTIVHVAAWTILTLLSIDKLAKETGHGKYSSTGNKRFVWYLIFIFSLLMSFLAGHLQIFLYGQLLILTYIGFRLFQSTKNRLKFAAAITCCYLFFLILTLPQSIPTINFINESARNVDLGQWNSQGWFIPWQNIIQFLAPDYFGNPTTGNYSGIWNYAEFVGYIGILPLIFALFSLFMIRSSFVNFYALVFIISLCLSFPTPLAKLPFIAGIPFLSTSQPTRLLFFADLALSVLAAFGFDQMLRNKSKYKIIIMLFIWIIFILLFFFAPNPVSLRNLILPLATLLFCTITLAVLSLIKVKNSRNLVYIFLLGFLIVISVFDLLRFSWKFTPFTPASWLYPETEIIKYLKRDPEVFRIMSLDRRIMPPNFSVHYKLQDVGGYDPLYLKSYNLLVSSWNSGVPQFLPASFNRIITPDNWDSPVTRILNVKYLLAIGPIESDKLKLVLKEGETHLYKYEDYLPRTWLAGKIIKTGSLSEHLEKLFDAKINLRTDVLITDNIDLEPSQQNMSDKSEIVHWSENKIVIKSTAHEAKVLVVSEIYHPMWKALVDGHPAKIYKVNYTLRGILLTPGSHTIEFYNY